jgi:hypothetical protein
MPAGQRPGEWSRKPGNGNPVAVVATLVCMLLAPTVITPPPATAADVTATEERVVLLSDLVPPSPDPSGIAWDDNSDRFIVSDSEVEEMTIFDDANLFGLDLQGNLTGTGDLTGPVPGISNEPTGLSFDPVSGHLFVSDDVKDKIFRIAPGGDGDFGTGDDTFTQSRTDNFGSGDPEDVAYDTSTGDLFVADGAGREVYRVSPGSNGVFDGVPPSGDDVVSSFDTASYGSMGTEGLGYDAVRDTLLIVDPQTKNIFEATKTGTLLNTIDLSVVNPRHAEDVVLAPSLADPGQMNMYVVARGVDNNGDPNENDGKMYEVSASLPPTGNQAPVANAGPDRSVMIPNTLTLAGSVSDDGLPAGGTLTSMWSQLSGPGTATFTPIDSPTTDVTFSAPGTYALRLTADDTALQHTDDVTVTVDPEGTVVVDLPIVASSDDAEESPSGKVGRNSTRLELATDGGVAQTVGVRFRNLSIPQGATILNSYVQFEADKKDSSAVTLTIDGEAADVSGTFTSTPFDISSRPRTTAPVQVTWTPDAWTVLHERGPKQRTPNLSPIVQEIVSRPGWNGVSLVLIVTGNGVGKRTAESFNAGAALAPALHVEYIVP